MILHIDMDAFFASIEQAVNPNLKGKPLIVGSRDSRYHTVVCAASYEAKALGIDSGMPSSEAFKLCPNLQFVPADQTKYIWTSSQIMETLKTYGFETVYASIDEFQLDILETENPKALAEKIQRQINETFNITASIGIAKNFILAKLASKLNKPCGIAMITEENIIEVLAKTPAKKLCGVGEKTAETLYLLGIKSCLDLYEKPPEFLERFLGKNGLSLYVSLHSDECLKNYEEEQNPKSIGHSYTLPKASKTPRFIESWVRLLAEMVAERLRRKNLVSHTIHLWLNGPEIGNFSAQRTHQQATNDGYEIYLKSLKIMAKLGPGMPYIRALGISCGKLFSPEYPPFFIEQKRREELLKTIDKINHKLGDGSIYPAIISISKKIA